MSPSIQNLCRAISQNTSYDAFAPALNAQQWETLASYLQPFDLGLVREALLERRLMAALAPHLVRPLPFVVPSAMSRQSFRSLGEVSRASSASLRTAEGKR